MYKWIMAADIGEELMNAPAIGKAVYFPYPRSVKESMPARILMMRSINRLLQVFHDFYVHYLPIKSASAFNSDSSCLASIPCGFLTIKSKMPISTPNLVATNTCVCLLLLARSYLNLSSGEANWESKIKNTYTHDNSGNSVERCFEWAFQFVASTFEGRCLFWICNGAIWQGFSSFLDGLSEIFEAHCGFFGFRFVLTSFWWTYPVFLFYQYSFILCHIIRLWRSKFDSDNFQHAKFGTKNLYRELHPNLVSFRGYPGC